MNADDLLDYQLGQLDDARREEIEQEIAADPELGIRSARLALGLMHLLDDGQTFSPPPGLADRTIAFVEERRRRPRILDLAPARVPFRWADFAVAAGIFLAGLATLLPAVQRSKSQMQEAACTFNLQQIGLGLSNYATAHGVYPQPPHHYPAGYYALQLKECGALHNPSFLTCPGRGHSARIDELPDSDGFDSLMGQSTLNCQRMLGDEYAFNAGFRHAVEGSSPVPADLARSMPLPLLADLPPLDDFHRVLEGNSLDHGGGGQNVLFSDHSVRWLRDRKLPGIDADIYLNQRRKPALGLHSKDVSLIPAGFLVTDE